MWFIDLCIENVRYFACDGAGISRSYGTSSFISRDFKGYSVFRFLMVDFKVFYSRSFLGYSVDFKGFLNFDYFGFSFHCLVSS